LAERGHTVHAVVGQPYYPDWRLFDRYHRRWKRSIENRVAITRCPHYIPSNPTGTRRLAHHLSFASAAWPSVRARAAQLRPELVFAVAPSMIAVPVARRAARKLGVPLWLHVQDFEVGAALATGLIGTGKRTVEAALRFEQRMLDGADIVSTISPAMRSLLVGKGMNAERLVELRNWANHADAVRANDGARLKREWGLTGKTVALYSGNISHKQGLDVVVEAARRLVRRGDLVFVIAGEGPKREEIARAAQTLPNVIMQGLQPDIRVGELLCMADIHLLPQIEGAADLVLPSKIGNMLASGRPVVATAGTDTGIAAELDGCGVVVPPSDPAALSAAIEALAGDPGRRRALGENGRKFARTRWAKNAVVDAFEDRMQLLLG